MNDYIELEAVLEVMDTIIGRLRGSKAEELLFTAARLRIKSLPTVDPVHAAGGCYCRECKWCREEAAEYIGYTPLVCMNANPEGEPVPTWQNCFCSKGEKEDTNG